MESSYKFNKLDDIWFQMPILEVMHDFSNIAIFLTIKNSLIYRFIMTILIHHPLKIYLNEYIV